MTQGPAYGHSDKTPEQRERIKQADQAAESVFGNYVRAGAWMFSYNKNICGAQLKPVDAAALSDEGLAAVQVELERLRPLTTPEPLPKCLQPGGRKKRRWR